MDPLSVSASIVGLLTAAGKTNALLETISSIRNAPASIREAQRETRHTEVALRSLHRFLQHLDPSNPRLEMIQVDELRVVLADAMLIFSSFEEMLLSLAGFARVRVAIRWTKYAKEIDEHLAKLERYKSSLALMLSILQGNSEHQARLDQAKLGQQVEQLLAKNAELKRRLHKSQDSFDARSIATAHPDDDGRTIRHLGDDNATIRRPGVRRTDTVRSNMTTNIRNSIFRFAFENILQGSRVYQNTAHLQESDRSFSSSVLGSDAWSVFTGYSLAKISVLSVIAMPISAADVANGQHYRDFSVSEDQPGQILTTDADMEDESTPRTSSDDGISVKTIAPSGVPGNTAPNSQAPNLDTPLATEESATASTDTASSHASTNETSSDLKTWQRNSYYKIEYFEDEKDFLCSGCREAIKETKGLKAGNSRWHLACWSCRTCKVPLEDDGSDVLLSSVIAKNGKLTCVRCGYNCGLCGGGIDEMGILVMGRVYCSSCFRCASCGQVIGNLVYGSRGDKIFCMACEDILWAEERETHRRSIISWKSDKEEDAHGKS
ncbi:hypothetical protein QBC44DRAFT_384998 [Cladorrhinum sp. PSN332]|nr:hypothetical protein QBC44DRAFT_384998 [Cladorrhinum sp. PSN332]